MNNEIYHMTTVEHHMTTTNTMLNRHTYTYWQIEWTYHTLIYSKISQNVCIRIEIALHTLCQKIVKLIMVILR